MSNKTIDRSYKRNRNYKYNIGDIIETKNSKIIIIGKTKVKQSGMNVKAYNCKCLIDKHEFIHTENYIDHKRDCPICCNSVIVKGINDISTTHPHLVKYFSDINDAYTHSYGSNEYANIKCPECGFIKSIKICRLFQNNYSCPRCGDNIKYPNKFMTSLLSQLNIPFENEYSPKWANGKKYDFYFEINCNKYIIEMDGGFHNKPHSYSGKTIEDIINIDEEKDKMSMNHNINIIRIDCDYASTHERFDFIKSNICKSILANIFNLNNINWDICNEFATISLVKSICEEYSNGTIINDISLKYKLDLNTVRGYLKQGNEIFDFVNYNPKKNLYENGKISATYNPLVKPLKCIETNQVFQSVNKCDSVTKNTANKFYKRYVREACCGIIESYKGFHFQYITREEFNKVKQQSPELAFGDFFILEDDKAS